MRWRGASSSEKLNAPPGAPPSGPLPRVSDMPPRLRRDGEALAEGAAEELHLALGGPARDLGALVGVEVQPDRAVLHVDVRRADALVARTLEILGEAQQAREPVEALGVAGERQRLQLAEVGLTL